jgi:hypothetical protein
VINRKWAKKLLIHFKTHQIKEIQNWRNSLGSFRATFAIMPTSKKRVIFDFGEIKRNFVWIDLMSFKFDACMS